MRIRIALATAAAVVGIIVSCVGFHTPTSAQAEINHIVATASTSTTTQRTTYERTTATRDAATFTPASVSGGLVTAALLLPVPGHAPIVSPPPPPPPPTDATSTDTADWSCIRTRESGDRYNDPNAPSGAYGILQVTWNSFGYSGWPYQAGADAQDRIALQLYNEYGWAPWGSRFACGL
jgi:Transglycosylase-like domain